MINEHEQIDDLQLKGLKLIQDRTLFCFGMDAVLLSNFSKIKEKSSVIDLGTGNGILPILLYGKYKASKIVGIEIVKKNSDIAKRNVILNKAEEIIEIINEDIKNLKSVFERGKFDYVITNPPYKKQNSGLININKEKAIAKHEIKCTLEDVISMTSYLLKDLGVMYMVNRPERLADSIELMRKYKIEPKVIKFVQPHSNKKPNLFLISGVKYGKVFLNIETNLIIREQNGEYTKELLDMYNIERGE